MPPRKQFSKKQVLEVSFEILRSEGMEGITARNIAQKMGSSVGPIYTEFENIEDVQLAALQKARDLMENYSRRDWSDISFLNMGVGFVCFARDEPVLFNICCKSGPIGPVDHENEHETFERMREGDKIKGFSDEELRSIFNKMSIFAFGMAALASQGNMVDDSTENIKKILWEAGGDIIFMAKVRSVLNDPKCTRERLNELWGDLDVKC